MSLLQCKTVVSLSSRGVVCPVVPRIGHRSDGEETGRFACQQLVVVSVDFGCLGCRPRFEEPLDEEAGFVKFIAGRLEWGEPVSKLPTSTSSLADHSDVEVAATMTKPVAGGMLPR